MRHGENDVRLQALHRLLNVDIVVAVIFAYTSSQLSSVLMLSGAVLNY